MEATIISGGYTFDKRVPVTEARATIKRLRKTHRHLFVSTDPKLWTDGDKDHTTYFPGHSNVEVTMPAVMRWLKSIESSASTRLQSRGEVLHLSIRGMGDCLFIG
jgi:hypothetical protein